jgi:pilus assembly protein CpaC
MRSMSIVCALAALASPLLTHAASSGLSESVVLQVNEQRQVPLPPRLERIAVADPAVADVLPLKGGNTLLVGKAPGRTTLMFWVRGNATPQRFTIEVRNAVQAGLLDGSEAKVDVQHGAALIEGSVPDVLSHERARQAAASAVGDKGMLADASTVASGGVVQVEVKVVEVNKTALRQLGLNVINRNGGFAFGSFGPSQLTSFTTTDGQLGFQYTTPIASAFNLILGSSTHRWAADLSVLQSNGMARVLAEPTLVALSGQSASFLAGGELPIPEPQGLGTTAIVFKPFGIGLTVTPTVLATDRIALKVAPEVSDLNYTNALMFNGVQIPSINTRRADTTVELGDGESFVVGGLVSRTTSSLVNKIPLLGDIPIIGAFFRDLNYSQNDKELVIVVTPHLVQPIARDVNIPLPGDREEQRHLPVWGSWLLNPASPDQLPGFSR